MRPSFIGHGVGLRRPHFERVLEGPLTSDWFEVISENFLEVGGRARAVLDGVRAIRPVVLHGVSLSIGSSDPLDTRYLDALRALAEEVETPWISDHLCWCGVGGKNAHDLLPLPYTEETLAHVVERTRRVQDRLKRRIALENVSSYMAYRISQMTEWEFLARVAEEADCGILLAVNNVYVSSVNHRFDPRVYLDAVPKERVFQIHLAGHSKMGELLLDTHDHPVTDPVWELYEHAVARIGPVATLIEWDDHIPPYERLEEERDHAAALHEATLARTARAASTIRAEAVA
jgi:hypothetical protein